MKEDRKEDKEYRRRTVRIGRTKESGIGDKRKEGTNTLHVALKKETGLHGGYPQLEDQGVYGSLLLYPAYTQQ